MGVDYSEKDNGVRTNRHVGTNRNFADNRTAASKENPIANLWRKLVTILADGHPVQKAAVVSDVGQRRNHDSAGMVNMKAVSERVRWNQNTQFQA